MSPFTFCELLFTLRCIPVLIFFKMKIRKKFFNPHISPVSDFKLRFYCVRLFYLCRNFKHRIDDVTKLVMNKIFNTNLYYSGSSSMLIFSKHFKFLWWVLIRFFDKHEYCVLNVCDFWNITFSQGSASFGYGGICNDLFVWNFVPSLAVNDFWKSINISRCYQYE